MSIRSYLPWVAMLLAWLAASLAGCGPPIAYETRPGAPAEVPPGAPPAASAPPAVAAAPGASPGLPARPAPRVVQARTLGPAATALVRQAREEAAAGDHALAAATLERALRIEPDHPLLWIELGRVRMAQHHFAQAEVMGRKALAAADDHATQALAWRLIAETFDARHRAREAGEARARAHESGSRE